MASEENKPLLENDRVTGQFSIVPNREEFKISIGVLTQEENEEKPSVKETSMNISLSQAIDLAAAVQQLCIDKLKENSNKHER